jgi:hypothetical protein
VVASIRTFGEDVEGGGARAPWRTMLAAARRNWRTCLGRPYWKKGFFIHREPELRSLFDALGWKVVRKEKVEVVDGTSYFIWHLHRPRPAGAGSDACVKEEFS